MIEILNSLREGNNVDQIDREFYAFINLYFKTSFIVFDLVNCNLKLVWLDILVTFLGLFYLRIGKLQEIEMYCF